jgi:hypothetical protein
LEKFKLKVGIIKLHRESLINSKLLGKDIGNVDKWRRSSWRPLPQVKHKSIKS